MTLEASSVDGSVSEANDPSSCASYSLAEERSGNEEVRGRWRAFWTAVQEKRAHTKIASRNKWDAIALGQVIAFSAASANAASYALSNRYDVQIQLFQLFLMYTLLSVHLLCREPPISEETADLVLPGTRLRLRVPWFAYLFMAILDVLPNFLILISFRFSSLTSTTLLGSLTIPSTMLFSHFLLARRFSFPHYVGVCLCLAGGIITGLSDISNSGSTTPYKNSSYASSNIGVSTNSSSYDSSHISPATGDFLALLAAVLYGLGDAVAEYSIKHIHRQEYLGMLGFFGAILTGLAFPWIEGGTVWNLLTENGTNHLNVLLLLFMSTLFVLFYYIAAAWFYTSSDATLLNLSMQTSNLWVILFSVLTYHDWPRASFYVALLLVVAGVVVYQDPIARTEEDPCSELEVEALVLDTVENLDQIGNDSSCPVS